MVIAYLSHSPLDEAVQPLKVDLQGGLLHKQLLQFTCNCKLK